MSRGGRSGQASQRGGDIKLSFVLDIKQGVCQGGKGERTFQKEGKNTYKGSELEEAKPK